MAPVRNCRGNRVACGGVVGINGGRWGGPASEGADQGLTKDHCVDEQGEKRTLERFGQVPSF